MKYTELNVDGYERVVEAVDDGFRSIIAIHNTNLGMALGGCRAFTYESREAQLEDALRLSKGMTYKSALAGLNLGGGKATIQGPATDYRLAKFAEFLAYMNKNGEIYRSGGDVGTGPKEIELLQQMTPHINHMNSTEDSGYATAYGVYMAMLGALEFHHRDIYTACVGIEGLGKVGMRLAKFLRNEAPRMYALDVNNEALDQAFSDYRVTPIQNKQELLRYSNIYSPCALGKACDVDTLQALSPGDIVCGGANNVFVNDDIAVDYAGKGITVVPDYLANAGGVIIINENLEDVSYLTPDVYDKLRNIQFTTRTVLERARDEKHTPAFIADRMAEERFNA